MVDPSRFFRRVVGSWLEEMNVGGGKDIIRMNVSATASIASWKHAHSFNGTGTHPSL